MARGNDVEAELAALKARASAAPQAIAPGDRRRRGPEPRDRPVGASASEDGQARDHPHPRARASTTSPTTRSGPSSTGSTPRSRRRSSRATSATFAPALDGAAGRRPRGRRAPARPRSSLDESDVILPPPTRRATTSGRCSTRRRPDPGLSRLVGTPCGDVLASRHRDSRCHSGGRRVATTRYADDRGLTAPHGRHDVRPRPALRRARRRAHRARRATPVFVLVIAGGLLFGAVVLLRHDGDARDAGARGRRPSRRRSCTASSTGSARMADMPKPRVGDRRHRRPQRVRHRPLARSARSSCVTTGLLRAPRRRRSSRACWPTSCSHVAHRDVTVMTVASFAGDRRRLLTRSAHVGRHGARPPRPERRAGVPGRHARSASSSTSCRFLLTAGAVALPRAVGRPRGRLLTGKPARPGSALQKITGDMARIPDRDLRQMEPVSRVRVRPGTRRQGRRSASLVHRRTRRSRSGSSSWPGSPPSSAER